MEQRSRMNFRPVRCRVRRQPLGPISSGVPGPPRTSSGAGIVWPGGGIISSSDRVVAAPLPAARKARIQAPRERSLLAEYAAERPRVTHGIGVAVVVEVHEYIDAHLFPFS